MKHYDKIFFAVALLACLSGVGVYVSLKPSAKIESTDTVRLKGTALSTWSDKAPDIKERQKWVGPEFDLVAGWNYDLFNSPETTWLTADSKYIAKELPPPKDDPFGIKLVSMEMPMFRLRISTVSCDVPPVARKDAQGKKVFQALVKFENANGGTSSIDFSRYPGTKMEKKEENGRTFVILTPRKPVPLVGQEASLKSFSIVKGKSEADDGTSYTRYMATIVDRSDKNSEVNVVEEFIRKANCLEAVFQDIDSSFQWRYVEKLLPGSEKPEIEIFARESEGEPFKSIGTEPSFSKGVAIYFVKGLDISTQEATITKQSASNQKTKRPKVRQQVLTPEK